MTSAELPCDRAGQSPVVVLIHGHPFSRRMWDPQPETLREHFRVMVPDLRYCRRKPGHRGRDQGRPAKETIGAGAGTERPDGRHR
jgi:pimeloyl-ACP methyl ester carboxylesterase